MRGHNEGSVYYWEARKRWVAEITTSFGQRKKFYCKTKQEALKKKNDALRELEQGALAIGPQQKLKDYLDDWIENVHKDKVRISTYVKYQKLIKYIAADLGDVWLQKLTPEQVRRFYTKKQKEGLSTKTVNSIHGVLHLALGNAVRWNYVSRNVCDLVTPPHVVSREVVPLSLEQAQTFLVGVREHRLEMLLTMAVVTGMRRGELLALRWSNIDFGRRTLIVLHTVDYIPKYGYVETEPKTKAGKRLISLPSFLVDMLKQYRVKQQKQRLEQGENWEGKNLVFTDRRGGYFNPSYLEKLFKKLFAEVGFPDMHFHDLRHSAATILLSMGINMKVIQELLGHSDIAITLGLYSHLLPSMQKEVTDMWDDVFGCDEEEEHGEDEEER